MPLHHLNTRRTTAATLRMAAFAAACPMALAGMPALAGELEQSSDGGYTWNPTECARPVAPILAPGVRLGDPEAQEAMLRYTQDTNAFIACIQSEAQADLDRAQARMHQAVQAALQAEADRATAQMAEVVRGRR